MLTAVLYSDSKYRLYRKQVFTVPTQQNSLAFILFSECKYCTIRTVQYTVSQTYGRPWHTVLYCKYCSKPCISTGRTLHPNFSLFQIIAGKIFAWVMYILVRVHSFLQLLVASYVAVVIFYGHQWDFSPRIVNCY